MSEDGPRVIALVGAEEHVLKSRAFGRACSGLKHFRRVGSDRKARYLEFFRRRYAKLKNLLEVARIYLSVGELRQFADIVSPRVAIAVVDDKLYNIISVEPKIREGSPKPGYMDNLVVIADNLANYFRILLRNNPKMFREKLKRFEK